MKIRSILLVSVLACLCLSGCEQKFNLTPLVRNTPTPQPASSAEASDTAVKKATATPIPTRAPGLSATPSPRRVGIREGSAGSVYVSNSSGQRIREILLQVSGSENWGRNLIPGEASVHVGEAFQLFYPPLSSGSSYNLRLVDNEGISYEIYGVDLADMENAILRKDEAGNVYLAYTSKSTHTEKDTLGSSWSNGRADEDEDSQSQYYDSTTYNNPFAYQNLTVTPAPDETDAWNDYDDGSHDEEWDYIGDGTDAWNYDENYDSDYYSGDDYGYYSDSPDEYYGIPYDEGWDYQSQY